MKIRDYIHKFNMTQLQFAESIKSPQGLVNAYITGKKRPSFILVMRIIEATGGMVGIEDLYPEIVELEKSLREKWTESEIKIYDCYKTLSRIT